MAVTAMVTDESTSDSDFVATGWRNYYEERYNLPMEVLTEARRGVEVLTSPMAAMTMELQRYDDPGRVCGLWCDDNETSMLVVRDYRRQPNGDESFNNGDGNFNDDSVSNGNGKKRWKREDARGKKKKGFHILEKETY
ncbi:hypothetical protein DEO72_LG4g111 [Vigna unguiculata]|uniref:Uncharacterized protein n=1 Tax=Vigna unguiculata TaxID=3917 RepID=A0A4D6LKC6_VIGUN|nr:hypothetical protein DEO72_LG4g111 [Vigna unguiculata]